MAKIREVFPADELPHKWVYNEYRRDNGEVVPITEARSDNYNGYGRCNFSGDEFRSYSTTIAKRYDLGEKGILFAFNTTSYGPTTANHLGYVRRAIPEKLKGRDVEAVGWGNNGYFPSNAEDKSGWRDAIDRLLLDAKNYLEKAKKARDNRSYKVRSGLASVAQAEKLDTLLSLDRGVDIARVKLDLERVPTYEPKPPNPNQRKYIRDWNDAMEYLPNLPMIAAKVFRDDNPGPFGANLDPWVATLGVNVKDKVITKVLDPFVGSKLTLKLRLSDCPWANIKVVGDRVLTSQGVRLGREEATRLYEAMLEVCRKQDSGINTGGYWIRFNKWSMRGWGKGYRMQNVVSVGCHYFDPSTLASGYKYLVDNLPTEDKITT